MIEFEFYQNGLADVFEEGNLVGELDYSVLDEVTFNEITTPGMAQILAKMRELQGK